jgi:hypothetical protein
VEPRDVARPGALRTFHSQPLGEGRRQLTDDRRGPVRLHLATALFYVPVGNAVGGRRSPAPAHGRAVRRLFMRRRDASTLPIHTARPHRHAAVIRVVPVHRRPNAIRWTERAVDLVLEPPDMRSTSSSRASSGDTISPTGGAHPCAAPALAREHAPSAAIERPARRPPTHAAFVYRNGSADRFGGSLCVAATCT